MGDYPYGYRYGGSVTEQYGVDSASSDIDKGDILVFSADRHVARASAGADLIVGVAAESAEAPASDGDNKVLVHNDPTAVFCHPPDAGTVSVSLIGKTCDVGGAQSIDIDAGVDNVILIVNVDVERNLVYWRLNPDKIATESVAV